MSKQAPPLFEHQKVTVDFILDRESVFILNDPGTGKTRTVLEAFARYKATKPDAKLCVLAPLSILEPSWGGDINKFTPELNYVVAYAKNRTKAFATDADIYISNHEACKYLEKDSPFGKPAVLLDLRKALLKIADFRPAIAWSRVYSLPA